MASKKNIEYILSLRDKFSAKLEKISERMEKFGAKATRAGRALTIAVTAPILAIGGLSLKAASDLEETQSKFDVVFSSIQKKANDFALNFKKAFGLSELASKKIISSTGDLLTGFGFTQEAAFDLSKQVNILAADLASFQNFEGGTEAASVALTKALLGETESAKALGIVIRQDNAEWRDNIALLMRTQGVTLLQAKALTALKIATEQSKNSIGDFSRTIGSFANQSRIAKAKLEDISVTIGRILMPTAQKILKVFNKWLDQFLALEPATKKIIVVVALLAATLGPLLLVLGFMMTTVLPGLISAYGVLATRIIPLVIAKFIALNAVILANPYVAAAVALAVLVTGLILFSKRMNAASSTQERFNRVQERFNRIGKKVRLEVNEQTRSLGFLFQQLKLTNPESEERVRIIKKINDQYPGLLTNISLEKAGIEELETAYSKLVASIEERVKGIILEKELTETLTRLRKVQSDLVSGEGDTKALQNEKDKLKLIEKRVKREILLMQITRSSGKEAARLFQELLDLQSKLRTAETPIFFMGGAEEEKELVLLEQKKNIASIKFQIKANKERSKAILTAGFKLSKKSNAAAAATAKAGSTTGGGGAVTKITSAAPKIFNINIDKLIEEVNINTTNLTEGTQQIKKLLVELLIGALSDTQTLTR